MFRGTLTNPDSHRGREGQKEGHEGDMKVARTDRFPNPSHFLESLKILATLSDLCDLCVSLSFAWNQRVAISKDKTPRWKPAKGLAAISPLNAKAVH